MELELELGFWWFVTETETETETDGPFGGGCVAGIWATRLELGVKGAYF